MESKENTHEFLFPKLLKYIVLAIPFLFFVFPSWLLDKLKTTDRLPPRAKRAILLGIDIVLCTATIAIAALCAASIVIYLTK